MNSVLELQKWYRAHCDGEWEHAFGVEISTLDNPGWRVVIALANTELATKPFATVERLEHETDWMVCAIRDGVWDGCGGPLMLDQILQTFLAWANERSSR